MALAGNWTALHTRNERFLGNWGITLFGVFVLSLAVFAGSITGRPISDDYQHLAGLSIGGGTLSGALTGPFLHDYYRPLTSLSYWIDLKLWGADPVYWHITNTILHAATAVLVAVLARSITKRKDVGALAGLFFAIQPAQASAVAWIGGRTDVLSALITTFYLISLVSYFQTEKAGWLAASAASLFLACAAKEQNLAYVVAAPLFERAFGTHTRKRSLLVSEASIAGIAVFALLWVVLHPAGPHLGNPDAFHAVQRIVLTPLHYAGLLLAPNPVALTAFTIMPYGTTWFLSGMTLLIAIPLVIWRAYQSDRRVGAMLAVATLAFLPISNLITIPSTPVAPYRVANIGAMVAILLAWSLAWAWERRQRLVAVACCANLLASVGATIWTVRALNSGPEWWTSALRFDPHARLIVRNGALALLNSPRSAPQALDIVTGQLDWIYGDPSWAGFVDRGLLPPITPAVKDHLIESEGGVLAPGECLAQLLNLRGYALQELGNVPAAMHSYQVAAALSPANTFQSAMNGIRRAKTK